MIKVLHIITDLALGGAEIMLCRVLSQMDSASFENEVISLTALGEMADKIRDLGIPVRALGMKRGVPNPFAAVRLVRWVRSSKPQVVQTWMYHANLLGGLAAFFGGGVPSVWGIHHTDLHSLGNRRLTIWTAEACALMSGWLPKYVVFCSQSALRSHIRLGYKTKKMEVIPNGFDLQAFKPDPYARLSVRAELGIQPETILIGIAARFHLIKDHHSFVRAAARLHARYPQVHFVLFGNGVTAENAELDLWMAQAGIRDGCHLLGERKDIARLFSAMDIVTSSSLSEAFPLAVGEAMACGTPCVVTNVGDSALIVDKSGKIVPPGNPEALAEAWAELIEAGPDARRLLGMAARRRVKQRFALPAAVEHYQAIYTQLAGQIQKSDPERLHALKEI